MNSPAAHHWRHLPEWVYAIVVISIIILYCLPYAFFEKLRTLASKQ